MNESIGTTKRPIYDICLIRNKTDGEMNGNRQ